MNKKFINQKFFIILWYISNQKIASIQYLNQKDMVINLPEYTTSQTDKNNDEITIAYFDEYGTHIALQKTDKQNNVLSVIIFNVDGSQKKTTYQIDGTKTVETFNPNHKINSRIEYNSQGNVICTIDFNVDNSQIKTTHNTHGTKTINYFNTQGQNHKKVEIDKQGNSIETAELHDDGTFTKTIHKKDKSQTKQHFNSKGQLIATTEINSLGFQITAKAKQLIAWHEAGHCLSYIYNSSSNLVQHVTIRPDAAKKSQGHVQSVSSCYVERTTEQLENDIISALCGGVGEQILLGQKMLTDHKDIIRYFAQERFVTDLQIARKDAREIISYDSINASEYEILQKIDNLLVRLYCKAYRFIDSHQNDMKKIADQLMQKEFLSSDETYDLVNVSKPFMMHEA